jgi:hypothetical protein
MAKPRAYGGKQPSGEFPFSRKHSPGADGSGLFAQIAIICPASSRSPGSSDAMHPSQLLSASKMNGRFSRYCYRSFYDSTLYNRDNNR